MHEAFWNGLFDVCWEEAPLGPEAIRLIRRLRAQARATEPGASRRSHPRRRDPSTSRSPPRATLASSTAGRPEKACCSMATSPGIQPTAWSMAVRISALPYATRSAYRSRDVGGKAGQTTAMRSG